MPPAASPFSRPAATPGPELNPFSAPPRLPTPAPAPLPSPPVANHGAAPAPSGGLAPPPPPPPALAPSFSAAALGAPSLARAPTPMPSANPFARSPPTNPFASPPRAPAPTPRIPQPAGVPAPATVSGIFQTPFAEAGLGADLDMPMIVVPPPAPALGPPPTAEAPGLSALFDDIPRSDPSIPLQRTIPPVPADQPATPGFDIEVDFGEQGAVGDDPTVDMPNAQPETAHPLGAAIVAAYEHNRTAPVEVGQVVEVSTASMGADSLDTEQSTLSMPSPIVVRLRDLQYRLTAEGRRADAEIVAQALALLDSGGSSG